MRKGKKKVQNTGCVDGSHEIILDSMIGEYVCVKCGLVLSKDSDVPSYRINPQDSMEQSNSGRYFVALGDRLNIEDGLGSYMGFQFSSFFHDENGTPLSSKKQALFKRLKYRYDLRDQIDRQEMEYRTLISLNRISSWLEPINANIKNRAVYFYLKLSKNLGKEEFYNHLNLLAVCIYLAIKESKNSPSLTIKEIANALQRSNRRVTTKSIIRTMLKIKPKYKDLFQSPKAKNSEDYLSETITKIIATPIIKERLVKVQRTDLDYEIALLRQSKLILEQIPTEKREGREPYIIALAICYKNDQAIAKAWGTRPILTLHFLSKISELPEYYLCDQLRSLL